MSLVYVDFEPTCLHQSVL
jgi:hypothetical protein